MYCAEYMKSFRSSGDTLKNQKLGLAMMAACLPVILFIIAYLFHYQRNTQTSQTRVQAPSEHKSRSFIVQQNNGRYAD